MTDSAEYQPDIIKGDGPQVVNFVPEDPTAGQTAAHSGAAAHE
jgi:hypothetical protein